MNRKFYQNRRLMSGLCIMIISLALIISLPAESFAASRTLNVTRVQQANTNWCWAACAEMFGKWEVGRNGKTQSQIVTFVKGSSVNQGANDLEIQIAMNFSIGYADYTPSKTKYAATKSYSWHTDKISSFQVVAAKFSWNSGSGNHLVIVNGYDDSKNTLLLTDPAAGCSTASYKYKSLVEGCTIQSGTGKYVKSFYKV